MKIMTAGLLACLSMAVLGGCTTGTAIEPIPSPTAAHSNQTDDQIRTQAALFDQVYANIVAQQAASHQDLASQHQHQATLNDSVKALVDSIDAKTASQKKVQRKIADVQQQLQISQLNTVLDNDASQMADKQAELTTLRRKVNLLQSQLTSSDVTSKRPAKKK